ncbi:lyase family protein [Paucibacter sp. APW11]|uniref:Lyase family protein n=1 Tax=Roseateles aquae TaxID=3077235 RepID=A0ABU3PH43_9BURK|nr:lyase family protein [Paucibacter sp. APW11]MDT9001438.1 lyase family protein [Paucibacter sp. APW11]
MSVLVFEGFLSTPEMVELFGETAIVQAMMDFEAALARGQARAGLMPAAAAQAIASLCRAELYDVAALVAASGRAGSLALPVVRKLAETVALFDPVAAGYVHWGGSSQDLIDTAMVLQTRRALRLIEDDLLTLCGQLMALAERYEATPVLNHGLTPRPQLSSLRVRLLNWLQPLLRSLHGLREAAGEALQLQLAGELASLSVLGDQAQAVAHAVADELQLPLPNMPWQTQRDRWLRLGSELALLCGNLGRVARELSQMAQAERGEALEAVEKPRGELLPSSGPGRPVACLQALAAAQRAPQRMAALLAGMAQDEDCGLGNWQAATAEWAGLLLSTHGALRALTRACAGLQLHPARMLQNIDRQQEQGFAEQLALVLTPLLGKSATQQRLQAMAELGQRRGLGLRSIAREVLGQDAELRGRLPEQRLEALFDPHAAAALADATVSLALQDARMQCELLLAARSG